MPATQHSSGAKWLPISLCDITVYYGYCNGLLAT